MKIIHIVSSLDKINFGIYNAAIFGSHYLSTQYKISSYAFVCVKPALLDLPGVTIVDAHKKPLHQLLEEHQLSPADTVVVSHGCWLTPSRMGYKLSSLGFRWIYVPHGMLEPWSLRQAPLKKRLYFHVFEKRFFRKADRIRAVSKPEQDNLSRMRNEVDFIPNGVSVQPYPAKSSELINFLFLGRLHYKKGIVPFVKAWAAVAANKRNIKLIIAGPDQGELEKVKPYLSENVTYVGAVYGNEKVDLIRSSHYFILPSFSEGFPVSALEAMSFGLIPLISSGCNFDEVFSLGLGRQIEPDEQQIQGVLEELASRPFDHGLSKKNWDYVNSNYSEEIVGDKLLNVYRQVIKSS